MLHNHRKVFEDYESLFNASENRVGDVKFVSIDIVGQRLSLEDQLTRCDGCQDYMHTLDPREKWDLYTEGVLKKFNPKRAALI